MGDSSQEEDRMLEVEEAGPTGAEGDEEMEGSDLRVEVVRLNLELQEANEEKLQAARYGLVVLEESAELKKQHTQLEEEHETLKQELQQLKEVSRIPVIISKKQKHYINHSVP